MTNEMEVLLLGRAWAKKSRMSIRVRNAANRLRLIRPQFGSLESEETQAMARWLAFFRQPQTWKAESRCKKWEFSGAGVKSQSFDPLEPSAVSL